VPEDRHEAQSHLVQRRRPAILSTVAGETQIGTLTLAAVQVHIKSGKLRGIGVMDKVRSPTIPQVPTMAEGAVEGVELLQWNGIFANAKTPAPIVARLQRETVKTVADPEVRQRFAAEGASPVGNSSAEFAAFFRKEAKIWNDVAQKANIKIGQ
jgi:tripartite-type tricarboxylate transporter receptor subunit TctC